MEFEHMVDEQASILLSRNVLPVRDKVYHFGKSIDKDADGGHALWLWKICD